MTAARRFLHDERLLDWGPLERLVKATPVSRNMVAADYMWMGAVELVDGRRLHLYKNAMTRRYVRLDSHGHAYAHVDGEYRIHYCPADAIDDLGLLGPISGAAIGQDSVAGTFLGGDTLVP